jgi:hypothetical protein
MARILLIVVIILSVGIMGGGVASVVLGQTNSSDVKANLVSEQVPLTGGNGQIITTSAQARLQAETIKGHRAAMAPTYTQLLGGKKFDPANPLEVTYVTAMDLENSLNVAVLAYGVTSVLTFNGVLMIAIGIALLAVAVVVWRFRRRLFSRQALQTS